MKESLRHICDTNRAIALSELFLGNKDCPALAIYFAYHIECLPYKSRVVGFSGPQHAPAAIIVIIVLKNFKTVSVYLIR